MTERSQCTNCGGTLERRLDRQCNRLDLVGMVVIGLPVIGILVLLAFAGLRKLAFLVAAAVAFGLYHFVGSRNVSRWRCPACGSTFDENRESSLR